MRSHQMPVDMLVVLIMVMVGTPLITWSLFMIVPEMRVEGFNIFRDSAVPRFPDRVDMGMMKMDIRIDLAEVDQQ
jgi:hypothetical protein